MEYELETELERESAERSARIWALKMKLWAEVTITEISTHWASDGAENCVWVLQFDGENSQTKSDI